MEHLQDIQWCIGYNPLEFATKKNKKLTQKDWNAVVFPARESQELVKFSLLLNDNYLFFVTRYMPRPVTVKDFLSFVYKFYQEPLEPDLIDQAFEDADDWKEMVLQEIDKNELIKFNVFTDTCEPDFCGLQFDDDTESYIVHIGPE